MALELTAHRSPREPRSAAAPIDLGSVRALLRGLDREQRRAVTHGEGPLVVLAGPGTGKTEVVTRRIAWLIASRRARPSEILALTFTDRAAAEMQARVDALVPYGRSEAAIHTFHAFGDRLVREHAHELGLPAEPRVLSRAETIVLLRTHVMRLGLQRYLVLADPGRNLPAIADAIARAKDAGIGPDAIASAADALCRDAARLEAAGDADGAAVLRDDAEGHHELARAYAAYEALLAELGAIDLAGQVALARRLLAERPSVAASLAARFRYAIVDEGQDANGAQIDLVTRIVPHGNVTVVGDDDQAIYGFRGAAAAALDGITAAYGGTARIVLRRNHRSLAPILAAAHRLISHNDAWRIAAREGRSAPLVATRRRRRPTPVGLRTWRTASEEGDGLAAEIAGRIAAGTAAREIAVLVRTNADAESIRRALEVAGVPSRSGAPSRLSTDPEVRLLRAFLRVLADPADSTSLYAVLADGPWALDPVRLSLLMASARRTGIGLWEALERAAGTETGDLGDAAATAWEAIRDAIADAHRRPAGEVLYAWLRSSGRYAALMQRASTGDDAPLRRVARFFELLRAHGTLVEDARAAILVPVLDALIDAGDDPAADDGDPQRDAVAVLTVHKAKGLEFPVVYVAGLVDGRFPARGRAERIVLPAALRGSDPGDADAARAEERRLAYVAVTRARDELVLSWAEQPGTGGRTRRPSPFIAEALDRAPEPLASRNGSAEASIAAGWDATVHAEPLRTPSALTWSQLDDLLTCPLRYHLRHRIGLEGPAAHPLAVGRALHEAVAAWHRARMAGGEPSVADLHGWLAGAWRSEGFLSREHEDARYVAARAALAAFAERERAVAGRRTLAVERGFTAEVAGVRVAGRYDRIDETSQGIVIVDYKTGHGGTDRQARERARDSRQLQLYALAWEAETGVLPAGMELRFLGDGMTGRTTAEPARLERLRGLIGGAARAAADGDRDPRPDAYTCGGCPFRAICPSSAV